MQNVQPLTEIVSGWWARNRFEADGLQRFGVAALLLAANGIFAVLSYVIAGRTSSSGFAWRSARTPSAGRRVSDRCQLS